MFLVILGFCGPRLNLLGFPWMLINLQQKENKYVLENQCIFTHMHAYIYIKENNIYIYNVYIYYMIM